MTPLDARAGDDARPRRATRRWVLTNGLGELRMRRVLAKAEVCPACAEVEVVSKHRMHKVRDPKRKIRVS
jgi:hypothetical protein